MKTEKRMSRGRERETKKGLRDQVVLGDVQLFLQIFSGIFALGNFFSFFDENMEERNSGVKEREKPWG